MRRDGRKTARAPARRLAAGFALCGIWAVTAACPGSFGDPLERVRSLHARGRYEASIEILRGLMDADPTDPEVNFLLAEALMQTGEPSMAVWPLQRAAESPAYAFEASMLLARATLDSQSPQDAIDALGRALAVRPDDVEALALRAHALLEAARYEDALADIARAVELEPDHAAIRVPRVLVLLAFGRVDEAEALLDPAPPAERPAGAPADEEMLARLCLAHAASAARSDDRKSAEVMYADCLDAYPFEPLVVVEVVEFYDLIGEPERGTALLERAFEDTRASYFGHALVERARRLRGADPAAPAGVPESRGIARIGAPDPGSTRVD